MTTFSDGFEELRNIKWKKKSICFSTLNKPFRCSSTDLIKRCKSIINWITRKNISLFSYEILSCRKASSKQKTKYTQVRESYCIQRLSLEYVGISHHLGVDHPSCRQLLFSTHSNNHVFTKAFSLFLKTILIFIWLLLATLLIKGWKVDYLQLIDEGLIQLLCIDEYSQQCISHALYLVFNSIIIFMRISDNKN